MKKIIMAVASAAVACCIGFAAVGCGGSQLITVFNRESGSGTRGAFTDILGIEEEELIPGAAQHSSTGAVVTAVADDPNAIGYISLGSLDSSVKALSVEGVVPSEATVQDGTYKIARPFELMYQEENVEKNDLLAEFLEYLESADVQPTVAEEGYVSLDKEFADYTAPEAQFETTTLDVGGSTSVQPFMAILAEQYEALIKETTGQEVTISVQGGGSGAGKTRFYCKPNLMQTSNSSQVILDPKGEILRDVGNLLEKAGYEIKVLDLISMEKSHCYNPFVYLRNDNDIQRLVTNLFKSTTPKGSQSNDPFWDTAASMLLLALVFYLHYEAPEEEQNFAMVMEMLRAAAIEDEEDNRPSPLDNLFAD